MLKDHQITNVNDIELNLYTRMYIERGGTLGLTPPPPPPPPSPQELSKPFPTQEAVIEEAILHPNYFWDGPACYCITQS